MVTTPEHGASPGHAHPLVRRDTLTASVCLTRAFLPPPRLFGVSRSHAVPHRAVPRRVPSPPARAVPHARARCLPLPPHCMASTRAASSERLTVVCFWFPKPIIWVRRRQTGLISPGRHGRRGSGTTVATLPRRRDPQLSTPTTTTMSPPTRTCGSTMTTPSTASTGTTGSMGATPAPLGTPVTSPPAARPSSTHESPAATSPAATGRRPPPRRCSSLSPARLRPTAPAPPSTPRRPARPLTTTALRPPRHRSLPSHTGWPPQHRSQSPLRIRSSQRQGSSRQGSRRRGSSQRRGRLPSWRARHSPRPGAGRRDPHHPGHRSSSRGQPRRRGRRQPRSTRSRVGTQHRW